EKPLVAVGHLVTRHPHDPLDVIERWILGIAEYHDFPALRIVHVYHLHVENRYAYAVSELVHQYEIAHQQGRQHRSGRNLERLHQEGAQQEHHQYHRKEALRILDPPGLRALRGTMLAQPHMIEQPYRPRHHQQHEQREREIHVSTFSMARNASCGISTVPTCFI